MYLIVFKEKEKEFVNQELPAVKDPTATDESGVRLVISQRYLSLLIPVLPLGGKIHTYYSLSTGEEIPKDKWSKTMYDRIDDAKPLIKGTWKLFSFFIFLFAFFAVATSYGLIANSIHTNKIANLEEMRGDLRVGDTLFLQFHRNGIHATTAKVTDVTDDTVVLDISSQAEPVEMFDFDSAIKNLKTSDDVYDQKGIEVDNAVLKKGRFNFKETESYGKYDMQNISIELVVR